MKILLAITIVFPLAKMACAQGDELEFIVRAPAKDISIEFSKGCLAPWRWNTVIIRGLPAGVKAIATFDKGTAWLTDSMCILIPYIYVPSLCLSLDTADGYRTDSIVRLFCIMPVRKYMDDSFALNWGDKNIDIVDTNLLSRREILKLFDSEFTFSDGVYLGSFQYSSIEMIISDSEDPVTYYNPSGKLSLEMTQAIKTGPYPLDFSLILHLKKSYFGLFRHADLNPLMRVDFRVSEGREKKHQTE